MTTLIELDQQLFFWINEGWQNSFFDLIMPYWRDKYFWVPLYLFIVSYALINFKLKGLYLVLAMLLTIGISDTTSSKVVKPTIKRFRPCRTPAIKEEVTARINCGPGYSFTSSHATNHFALAVFLSLTLGARFKWIRIPLLLWAASISLGQVYVGVHFPLDIIGGALLGSIIGIAIGILYNQVVGELAMK